LKFIVTCFGPFKNQSTNPTLVLGPALSISSSSHPNVDLVCVELPVSKAGVDAAMDEVWSEHVEPHASSPSSRVIILHMGVDGTQRESGVFKLERRGVNQLDFRIPDNEGFQPRKLPIEEGLGQEDWLGSMGGPLEGGDSPSPFLDRCLTKLEEGGWEGRVVASDDAGRFVCNYTLFTTLARARLTSHNNVKAMFLHVPNFTLIEMDEQGKLLGDLAEALVEEVRKCQ